MAATANHTTLQQMDHKLESGQISAGEYKTWWNSVYGSGAGSTPATTQQATPATSRPTTSQPTTYSQAAQQTAAQPATQTTGNNGTYYQVKADGSAPEGLAKGSLVVTGGGTYKIEGVDANGKYISSLVEGGPTTSTFTGTYAQAPTQTQQSAQATSQPNIQQAAGNSATYTIGTQEGAKRYESALNSGQRVVMNDGAILMRGSDGKVYAEKDGVWVNTNVTYTDTSDSDAMADTLVNLYSGDKSAYKQATTNQQAANNAAVQKAVNDLESQKTTTNQSYADLFRQLYINKMNAQKNQEQKLAAQGITGGMAETNRLAVEGEYSEDLRQGEIQRLAAIAGLDKAITDTRLTGDIENATVAANNAIAGANSYAQVLQTLIGRNDTLSAQEKSQAYALALQMLQSGNQVSDVLREQAGISQSDADSILAGATKVKYTAEQAAMALQAAKKGDTSEETRKIVQTYYGMPLESAITAITEETVYTAEQAAVALMAARNGSTDPQVQEIVQSYYKMPLAEALKAQSTTSPYTAEQAAAALMAAKNGDTSKNVRDIVQSYYQMPLESVLKSISGQSVYNDAQVQMAVSAALAGNRTEQVRTMIESYYGLPLETVMQAYSTQ